MSLEDFTNEKWIENIKERQAIEFKKHKGTSLGIYLELLGETITQNNEAFQSQKAIAELAVKALETMSTGYLIDCKSFSITTLKKMKRMGIAEGRLDGRIHPSRIERSNNT